MLTFNTRVLHAGSPGFSQVIKPSPPFQFENNPAALTGLNPLPIPGPNLLDFLQ